MKIWKRVLLGAWIGLVQGAASDSIGEGFWRGWFAAQRELKKRGEIK